MKRIQTVACSTLVTLPLILPVASCAVSHASSAARSTPARRTAAPAASQGQILSSIAGMGLPATHQRVAVVRLARAQALARAKAVAAAKAKAQAAARARAAAQPKPAKTLSTTTLVSASAPSVGGVRGMINQVFGSYAAQATRVALCESGLNPSARNPSGASGVFQILPSTWATTPYHASSPFNAWANINAAHWIFVRDGYSWREWQCAA